MRLVGLAAASLLAGVLAVALSESSRADEPSAQPQPALGAFGEWTPAVVGVAAPVPRTGRAGDCGWLVLPSTQGIIHPVLPCGARVILEFRGHRALTRVVARSPVADGRQFDVTPRLASALRLDGVRRLQWAFSR